MCFCSKRGFGQNLRGFDEGREVFIGRRKRGFGGGASGQLTRALDDSGVLRNGGVLRGAEEGQEAEGRRRKGRGTLEGPKSQDLCNVGKSTLEESGRLLAKDAGTEKQL